MKALLLSEYNHLEITNYAAPTASAAEVLVRVAACGICGSDVHGYDGTSGRRIPPLIMGHEAAGVVTAVGGGVTRFAIGDRVTFDSTVFCGTCAYCLRGETNLCGNREVLGVSCGDYRRNGAFAEYVSVPARIVYRLPESISFAEAAMLEAVAVAVHAVSLVTVDANSVALVVGAGTIGLLCMQALRAAGCGRVYIADVDESRLPLANTMGAAGTLLAGRALRNEVKRLSEGEGVDVVVEAVGRKESIASSIDAVRKGGVVVLVGNISPEVAIPLQKIVSRQIRLQGSCASAGEYPRAIELMAAGAINVKPMISVIAPLEEGPHWFKRLHAGEPGLTKVVLTPGGA
jgi:L-iditol 2-dehydrogenase